MIDMQNLVLGYGDKAVLNDVNTCIKQGEYVGIIGPSGAGKTTLLKALIGNVKVLSGDHCLVQNFDLAQKRSKADMKKLRAKTGFIFQGFNLVNRLSVLDNVMSGMLHSIPTYRAMIKLYSQPEYEKAAEYMKVVGLLDFALRRCDELSGGQRQRVAIARALAQEPTIILADEPVSALDPVTARSVLDILRKVNEIYKVTVIINLHQLDYAKEYCQRIIGINHGKIIFDDSVKQLSDARIEEIYQGQQPDSSIPVVAGNVEALPQASAA